MKSLSFAEADKVEHPVETQWHYPIMTSAGFKPQNLIGVGFVRSYLYTNESGYKIRCSTGCHADHWEDLTHKNYGYHGTLGTHLKQMKEKS